ncbi:hypothetical protein DTO166G4_939 [Paecilomyces variotii]|nr:hypothetical protein DTO166G4_939 [Paecilomyces variotii]KAJ9231739.1 hypothetical protein DTO166G5_6620 [Paecilomyces variotii]KAJ9258594.1 hypothetical protein DTO195F2_5247 [Paecilomyces variotii]KAJ9373846.1 hypothetical protein DTO282E5_1630 [Paecilomyces variotii]
MSLENGKWPRLRKEEDDGEKDVRLLTASSSRFLNLPPELRYEIYKFVFSSTILNFYFRINTNRHKTFKRLALLLTCRQVHSEIGSLWVRLALFNFERIDVMMETLAKLPEATLSQVRYARTLGNSAILHTPVVDHDDHNDDGFDDVSISNSEMVLPWECSITLAMKLLPTLRLRRLTILTPYTGEEDFEDACVRLPQPAVWNSILRSRDGICSEGSVTIYRTLTPNPAPGTVMKRNLRQGFEQEVPSDDDEWDEYGEEEDLYIMSEAERTKEVLVIVKRGPHVNIGVQSKPEWLFGKTWAHVQQRNPNPSREHAEHTCLEELDWDEDWVCPYGCFRGENGWDYCWHLLSDVEAQILGVP